MGLYRIYSAIGFWLLAVLKVLGLEAFGVERMTLTSGADGLRVRVWGLGLWGSEAFGLGLLTLTSGANGLRVGLQV